MVPFVLLGKGRWPESDHTQRLLCCTRAESKTRDSSVDERHSWIESMNGGSSVTSMSGHLEQPSRPNKSLQPTATAVMPPAAQEIMPAVAVAEH